VRDGIETALRKEFDFAAREFGQPVFASEVIAAAARAPGVVAVDLTELLRPGHPTPLRLRHPVSPVLAAAGPTVVRGVLRPAELLTLTGDLTGRLREMS
jgi:hypothetical protein